MVGRRAFLELGTGAALSLAATVSRRALAEDQLLVYGASPQNLATPISYFDRLITPTNVFFVRSHFGPPAFDRARKLTIEGLVKKPLSLSLDDLRAFPEVTLTAVLQCAGNGRAFHAPRVPGVQWDHGAMGQATWTGVRLRDVLARAEMGDDAQHARLVGADLPPKREVPAFVRSIPRLRALDPSTLLAYRMNGEPLSLQHGAPLRLVVPGWAGDHWVKWIAGIRLQTDEAEGFYMQTAYRFPVSPGVPGAPVPPDAMRPLSTFPVRALIARPTDGGRAAIGPQEIVGVAFSGEAPIARVEISLDEGKTWRPAALEGEAGVGRWQVFRMRVDARRAGPMRALARAIDAKKNTQPERPIWNPSGYHWNAWHAVSWEVA